MWGYNPPKDSSRKAMEPPMVWVDMEFDRSPSELLWIDSRKWGALQGHLLSFSYGYGKIQLVLNEKVNGQMQGGVIDLPGVKFLTEVMRGRFNPSRWSFIRLWYVSMGYFSNDEGRRVVQITLHRESNYPANRS